MYVSLIAKVKPK